MHKRIEITGIIASGKTTLARVLGEVGLACPVFESFTSNPFYDAFYRDPASCAFETELTFLLQHYHDVRDCCRDAERIVICDFSFELDFAYAATTLNDTERRTFSAVYEHAIEVVRPADILVALKCSPREALRRIHRRARPAEQSISVQYLHALAVAINDRMNRTQGVVIEIDSQAIDFRTPGDAQDHIAQRLMIELQSVSLAT